VKRTRKPRSDKRKTKQKPTMAELMRQAREDAAKKYAEAVADHYESSE